jgi:hypothetical protein
VTGVVGEHTDLDEEEGKRWRGQHIAHAGEHPHQQTDCGDPGDEPKRESAVVPVSAIQEPSRSNASPQLGVTSRRCAEGRGRLASVVFGRASRHGFSVLGWGVQAVSTMIGSEEDVPRAFGSIGPQTDTLDWPARGPDERQHVRKYDAPGPNEAAR